MLRQAASLDQQYAVWEWNITYMRYCEQLEVNLACKTAQVSINFLNCVTRTIRYPQHVLPYSLSGTSLGCWDRQYHWNQQYVVWECMRYSVLNSFEVNLACRIAHVSTSFLNCVTRTVRYLELYHLDAVQQQCEYNPCIALKAVHYTINYMILINSIG